MSNSKQAYSQRSPGLSDDRIRDLLIEKHSNSWSGKCLDLGTGRGGWARRLRNDTKVSEIECLDIVDCRDEDMKDLKLALADLAKDPFPVAESSFDFIFAVEVIEHIENPRHFIREVYKALKPGGTLIISTPSVDCITSKISYLLRGYFPPFCQRDYKESGHITAVSKIDFKRMAQEAGFNQITFDFSLPGRIPGMKFNWQNILPFLEGPNFSDTLISFCIKD